MRPVPAGGAEFKEASRRYPSAALPTHTTYHVVLMTPAHTAAASPPPTPLTAADAPLLRCTSKEGRPPRPISVVEGAAAPQHSSPAMTTLPVHHVVYGRGTSTSIVTQGVRKTHTTFLQGTEMVRSTSPLYPSAAPHPSLPFSPACLPSPSHLSPCQVEEFDATTELLKSRRVRHRSDLGAQGPWKYEVGDPIQVSGARPLLAFLSPVFCHLPLPHLSSPLFFSLHRRPPTRPKISSPRVRPTSAHQPRIAHSHIQPLYCCTHTPRPSPSPMSPSACILPPRLPYLVHLPRPQPPLPLVHLPDHRRRRLHHRPHYQPQVLQADHHPRAHRRHRVPARGEAGAALAVPSRGAECGSDDMGARAQHARHPLPQAAVAAAARGGRADGAQADAERGEGDGRVGGRGSCRRLQAAVRQHMLKQRPVYTERSSRQRPTPFLSSPHRPTPPARVHLPHWP